MGNRYKHLGDYIHKVENRNRDLKVSKLVGLSMTKEFRVSTSNIVGTDMSVYKVVNKWQFSCDFMSVIRVHKFPVVLKTDDDPVLVSPAYTVFEVNDENELNPEYLMMWFRRSEFDRYADFKCDSAIRGGFDWDALCDCMLPIPSIEKQREIVREYNTIQNRIALNNQMISKLEDIAQAIYKQWFVDFEFPFDFAQGKPSENGKPYKSNGGKMVWCEELEKEIPEGWEVGTIDDLFTFQRGHDLPSQDRVFGIYPIYASTGISEYHNEFKSDKPTIITGRSGTLGELFYVHEACWPLNTTLYIKSFKNAKPFYAFYFLKTVNLKEMGAGSAVPTLNRNDIHALKKEIPSKYVINLFEDKISKIFFLSKTYKLQNQKLEELKELLLGRMVRIEN
jgi:type I restriction enzyme S subunit